MVITFGRCRNLEARLSLIASRWDISLVQVVCQSSWNPSLVTIKTIDFPFFITRCGTSSFRRLFRKRGDDTFKKLSGAWHPPKWLFWGSGVLFSFFLAYCIDLLDFGFWTSIFKLPSSGNKIFQGWSTFLQYRFFLSTSSKLQVVRCFGTWRASFASLQEVPRGKGGWSELSLKPLPSITFLF